MANHTTSKPVFETACIDMTEAELDELRKACAGEKYQLTDFAPAVNEVINAMQRGIPKKKALDNQSESFGLDRKTLKRWVEYRLDHPIVKK